MNDYTKPREIKAYDDGLKAGLAGAALWPHPWAGKQTNFVKPVIKAWEHGWRDAKKERDRADVLRQERLVEDGWSCDVCYATNAPQSSTCLTCLTKRPTPEHEAALPRIRAIIAKHVAELPDEETEDTE